MAGTFAGLPQPTGRRLTGRQIIPDSHKRGKIISFYFQKRQAFRAVSTGVHLLAELGIFLHSLDKPNSDFHGHLLNRFFGMEVKELKF